MDGKVRNGKIALYTTLEIIAVLVLTLVGNMWDWVNLTFTLSKITTAAYWSDVFVQVVMYTCSLLIGIFGKLEREELNSVPYHDSLNLYHLKWEIKEKNDQAFASWVDNELNPSIKIEYLKKKFQKKLYWLDKHATDEAKVEFYAKKKDEEFIFTKPENEDYYKRRTNLEKMMSDEFLKDNYMALACKYPRVNAQAFTYYLDIKISNDLKYKVENEIAKDVPKRATNKIIIGFASAAVIGTILWQPNANELLAQANGWIVLLIKYMVRVMMVCVNLGMGIFTGKKLFNSNFVLPIINRTRILGDYIAWFKDHPTTSEYQKEIKTIKDEYAAKIEELEEMKTNLQAQLNGVQ